MSITRPRTLSLCICAGLGASACLSSSLALADPLQGLTLTKETVTLSNSEFSIGDAMSVQASEMTVEYSLSQEGVDTWHIYGDAKVEIGNQSDDADDSSDNSSDEDNAADENGAESNESEADSSSDTGDTASNDSDEANAADEDATDPCNNENGDDKDKAEDSDGDGSQEIVATFGSADEPGLVITGETLESLNIGLAGRFELGKLVVCVLDADPAQVQYDKATDSYALSGELAVQELWSASLMLGTAEQPGVVIDKGHFQLDGITVDVNDVHVGTLTMKKVEVAYSKDSTGEVDFEVDLDVVFPPEGMEIDADVKFVDGKLDQIGLTYSATGDEQGIEIGDSGVSIAELGASLDNLDQPSDLQVKGTIGLEFGGQMKIDDDEVTVLRSNGNVDFDSSGMTLDDKVYLGAKQGDDDTWTGLLGTGDATLDLDWSEKQYQITGTLQTPADPGLIVDATVLINSHGFDFIGDAKLEVPEDIDVIGGMVLDEIGAALRSVKGDPDDSYGAGWTKILLSTVGLKYNFGSQEFSLIGGTAVDNIKSQVASDEADADYSMIKKSFQFPEAANALMFKLSFTSAEKAELAVELATMKVSPGESPLSSVFPDLFDLPLKGFSLSGGTLVPTPFGLVIVGPTPVALTYHAVLTDDFKALAKDGKGELNFRYLTASAPNLQFDLEVTAHYPTPVNSVPEMTAGVARSVSLTRSSHTVADTMPGPVTAGLSYWTHGSLASGAKIHLYVDDDNQDFNGRPVASNLEYGDHDPIQGGSQQVVWDGKTFHPGSNHAYYLYSVFDDGINEPIVSPYSQAVLLSPPIHGSITDPRQNLAPIHLARVYLDLNKNGRFDHGEEPVTLSNRAGEFAFHEVAQGEVNVAVLLSSAYRLDKKNGSGQRSVAVDYQGEPQRVDFSANQLASVGGVVFEDSNNNSTLDVDEVGMAGVTLFLDDNADGLRDENEITARSHTDGRYRFYSLRQDKQYRVSIDRDDTMQFSDFVATTSFEQAEAVNFAVTPANNSTGDSSVVNSSSGGSSRSLAGSGQTVILILMGLILLLGVRTIRQNK